METHDLEAFATSIAEIKLREVDNAVALLWFHDHFDPNAEMEAGELGSLMNDLGLSSRVNKSRLARHLRTHKATVLAKGGFRLRRSERGKLDQTYLPLMKRRRPLVKDTVLPTGQLSARPYLDRLAWEINGCHTATFYNGCAVLCRRLIESLLIAAFDRVGHIAEIKQGQDYVPLSEIIAKAKSGQFIRLSKNTRPSLGAIKEVGDRAAHHPHHMTSKQDIDSIATGLRAAVSELLGIAGLGKS